LEVRADVTTTLVLGGARSGKSAVAERLAARLVPPVAYLATAVLDPQESDFAARIEAHRARRPPQWRTVEVGGRLPAALLEVAGSVLVDSLGSWVAAVGGFEADVEALCSALRERAGDTVVVSEEVGLGVHPATELGRRFRDVLGLVNQAVAEVADEVWLVVAGRVLPLARLAPGVDRPGEGG
jgi:adenosyl cobinamide kinase/adenosyl cobinamide phosphate guanylyltransferase